MIIRRGQESDLPAALALIRELAVFEREPDAVTNTLEMMKKDGFGEHPVFGFFVAEWEKEIVGLSLYYYRYSTWKGKCLYLEDLIVTENHRGKGIGKALFDRTIEQARSENLPHMMWQVLDWNEAAIDFYKQYGADLDSEWLNCKVDV